MTVLHERVRQGYAHRGWLCSTSSESRTTRPGIATLEAGERLLGFILYRAEPDRITLIHTEVEPELEHQGVASQLVAATLDDIRARGLAVVPICPFVLAYIRRHPEYAA
ncbi:MAG: GNAT family N-acetyltransferase [Thermoleophilia bacterium]